MNKVIRYGKVGVLYSPGFGAGWYTWNTEVPQCIFSPEIIKMVEEGSTSLIDNEFCEELFGVNSFYSGGAGDLNVVWLDEGTQFTIEEYDGSESLRFIEDISITAWQVKKNSSQH